MLGTLVRGCVCAASWCDHGLIFDLAVVNAVGYRHLQCYFFVMLRVSCLYWLSLCLQSQWPAVDEHELKQMDTQITEKTDMLRQKQIQIKKLEAGQERVM